MDINDVVNLTKEVLSELENDRKSLEESLYNEYAKESHLDLTFTEFLIFTSAIASKMLSFVRNERNVKEVPVSNYDTTLLNSALRRIDELEARLEAKTEETKDPVFVKSPWVN